MVIWVADPDPDDRLPMQGSLLLTVGGMFYCTESVEDLKHAFQEGAQP